MKRIKQWIKGAFKGFTLIELLVVVIIIGILAAIGIPQYTKTIEKARGAEGRTGLGHIQEAEKLHYVEHEEYTSDIGDLDINIGEVVGEDANGTNWNFAVTLTQGGTGLDGQGFYATATRQTGRCLNDILIMDFCGELAERDGDDYHNNTLCTAVTDATMDVDDGWVTCVDDL